MNIKKYLGLNSLNKKENGEKVTHKEKYTQIVNDIGIETCKQYLPTDLKTIKKAYKEDKNLNNIDLEKWVMKHDTFKHEFYNIGINSISLSDTVCTLKQAATMLIKEGI